MVKAAMVAALNNNAGKGNPMKRKRIEPHDISFGPVKKARTTGTLSRKSTTTATDSRTRRSSYSLPEDSDATEDRPRHKALRQLHGKKEVAGNPSPLKQVGFSPKEIVAPGRVNLDDSPTKLSRNRPVPALQLQSIEPVSTPALTSTKRTRLSVKKGDFEQPPETWDKDREPMNENRNKPIEADQDDATPEGTTSADPKETEDDENEVSSEVERSSDEERNQNGEEGHEEDESGPTKKQPRVVKLKTGNSAAPQRAAGGLTASTQNKKRRSTTQAARDTRAETVQSDDLPSTQDRVKESRKTQRKRQFSANRELTAEQKEAQFRKHGEGFISSIHHMTTWYGCHEDWKSLGAVARNIRLDFQDEPLKSQLGEKIRSDTKNLTSLCRGHTLGKVSTDNFKLQVIKLINQLEKHGETLTEENLKSKRKDIVLDLYHHIIPDVVFVVRSYMMCLPGREEPFTGWELRRFVNLLAIANNFIELAATWQPRPTTAGSGVLEDVKLGLRPQFRRIYRRYETAHADEATRDDMEEQMRRLEANQKIALAAHAQRKLDLYARVQPSTHRDTLPKHSLPSRYVFDIESLELNDEPPIAQTYEIELQPTYSKLRSERQATEEIAPPPMDWTEDEKTALLNALEVHQGDDRYWQIQDTCSELQDRSLDDLRTAALYFRDLILSAAEFSGMDQSAFMYLLSVE